MKSFIAPLMIFMLTLQVELISAEPLSGDNIQLETDKGVISLQSLRGKVIYLDFWASWCSPCQKSFPWMNEMHQKYSDKGLVIVAVNVDEKRVDASRLLTKIPADFIIAYDSEGKLAPSFGLKAMPSSYVIAADGSIAYRHIGFKEKMIAEYEKSIRSALGLDPGS
jgi:cytochrome c biogenesis protein CcmG, thiol:disulfide interchange protein DsbE